MINTNRFLFMSCITKTKSLYFKTFKIVFMKLNDKGIKNINKQLINSIQCFIVPIQCNPVGAYTR